MNLKYRLNRLESQHPISDTLTTDQQIRLQELSEMESDHPDYNVLEYLELYYLSRPGLTFEQFLRESEVSGNETEEPVRTARGFNAGPLR